MGNPDKVQGVSELESVRNKPGCVNVAKRVAFQLINETKLALSVQVK